MELKVGCAYESVELQTPEIEGLEAVTKITNLVVMDRISTATGFEYVIGTRAAIPEDWIISAIEASHG